MTSTLPEKTDLQHLFSLPVIVAALGYFVDIYDLQLFGIVRISSLLSLGLTPEEADTVGITILDYQMIGLLIGGIFWGMLGDKKGRLSVLFGSIITYSLANIACGFIPHIHFVNQVEAYKWLRFIAGLGLAGELGAGITLVSEILPKHLRAIGTSLVAGVGLAGAVVGAVLSLVYAVLTVPARANQFASGLAVWMLGFGLSAYAGAGLVGQRVEGFTPLANGFTPTMVLALLLVPCIGLWLYTTRTGLAWRAVGESPDVARAAGVQPALVIVLGIAAGGLLSGLGGAALSVDYTRTWAEGMSGGRGLVAVGLVIVARWNPWWTLPAALLFGCAEAMSLRMQAAHSAIPAHLLHTLPYLASLAVFAIACVRLRDSGAPAALKNVLER